MGELTFDCEMILHFKSTIFAADLAINESNRPHIKCQG